MEHLADPTTGELRIASHEVMAAGFLPAIIKSLHRRHPSFTVHVKLAVAIDALYNELRDRNVDLILGRILTPFAQEDLNAEVLFNEPTVVVAGRRNRFTRRRKIGLAELIDEPWVFPAAGSIAEGIAVEMFRLSGLGMPRRGVVHAGMPMHGALVANGPYLATLPGSLVYFGGNHLSVKVLPIKVPVSPSPVGIITLKRRTINPVVARFIECARDVAKSMAARLDRRSLHKTQSRGR
jgi:DNA-binding transcriptional LysR family regulator